MNQNLKTLCKALKSDEQYLSFLAIYSFWANTVN